MLPGFPHICRQVIEAIDAGKRYADLTAIVEPDGALQASIIHTANQARYGARQRIETLPSALSMIGVEATRKIVMGRAMSELMEQVDQAGFDIRAFFFHSTAVGYLAQLISLNFESPSPREREIIQSLRLPNYVQAALEAYGYWKRFEIAPDFDAFTAGILHDTGKVLNTVCYPDVFPMILYEYERSQWQSSLLQSEIAVVGDFQHPVTSGALLERWEVFPNLIEPVRNHHTIHSEADPAAALVALANCLAKAIYPFPRTISISDEYRSDHLGPVQDSANLENPLPGLFQGVATAYDSAVREISLSTEETDSGEYETEHVEAVINAARSAVASDPAMTSAYIEALAAQNPEVLALQEWTDSSGDELLALTLVLKDFVSEVVNGLFRGTPSR